DGEVRDREERVFVTAGHVVSPRHGLPRSAAVLRCGELPPDLLRRRYHFLEKIRRKKDGRLRQPERDRAAGLRLETALVAAILLLREGGVVGPPQLRDQIRNFPSDMILSSSNQMSNRGPTM